MYNKYNQILTQVSQTESVVGRYLPAETIAAFLSEAKQKARDERLHIMLYGAYNAGKSTMINVLLGQSQAAVNDVPTTDSVDEYDWQGMVLVDTPGVNAPIQHQQITEQHLKRISAILFVIREGDMDSKDVYSRLLNLVQRKKQVFIVLNNQLSGSLQCYQAVEKIRLNLVNAGVDQDYVDNLSIYPINLKTAFKGRLENKAKLVEHSGFQLFLEDFDLWLNLQKDKKVKFEEFKSFVNDCWFQPAIAAIEKQTNKEIAEQLQNLLHEKATLHAKKNSELLETQSYIRLNLQSKCNK